MDTIKVYIANQKDTANIDCPSCHKVAEVSITAPSYKHRLKVRCNCNNVFWVEVEFRDKSRKFVDFPGFYEIVAEPLEIKNDPADGHGENIQLDQNKSNCQIIDLSRIGIGFITQDDHQVKVGDLVELSFVLDNEARSKISQACRIKHINDHFVGGKILAENTTMDLYLLN